MLAEEPALADIWLLLAWAQFESGAFGEAICSAERCVSLQPLWLDGRRLLGRSLERDGQIERAIEHLAYCASRASDDGEDQGRYVRVRSKSEAHRDEAREAVRAVVVRASWSARAVQQWLRAAVSLGEVEASERLASALLEKAPNDGYFRGSIASCMSRLGRHESAREHAIAAIAIEPNLVLAWTVRSLACARMGLEEERVECELALRAARAANEHARATR